MEAHFENMRDGYAELAKLPLLFGHTSMPRGMETRELLDFSFIIDDPTDTIPVGTNRALSLPFAAVEAAQLVAGASMPELLVRINPTMDRFLEWSGRGKAFKFQNGAYGPRIGETLPLAVQRLIDDSDTRQAILTIFDPARDYRSTPDVPCTLSLQFFIRESRLFLLTTMRSNDVWWGVPYDVFQFTQLQLTVANALGVEPGRYHHRANSFHAYIKDADGIEALTTGNAERVGDHPLGFHGSDIEDASNLAWVIMKNALYGEQLWPVDLTDLPSEQWYLDRLRYVSPRATISSSEED